MLRRSRSFMSMARRQVMRRGVEAERVAPVQVVVDHRRQQVVGRGDGVEVAGEMEVDVLHRRHLGAAAAGGPALHPEAGAERGLAQADHGLRAERVQRIAEADGGGGLALAGRGRADAGDQHQLARPASPSGSRQAEIELGLVAAEGDQRRVAGCRRGRRWRRSAAGSRRARSRGRWPWRTSSRQAPRAYRPGRPGQAAAGNHPAARLWLAWQAPASMSAATTRPPAGASAAA